MPHPLRCAVLSASLLSAAAVASAQPAGDLTTWVGGCQATAPDLQALLQNEALVVHESHLTLNFDGTYALSNQPFLTPSNVPGAVQNLCPNALFYGQPQVPFDPSNPLPFRSAVQVGTDLVLTAWHGTFPNDPAAYRIVFGVHDRLIGGVCFPVDFSHIPAANVYEIDEVVADGWSAPLPADRVDYVLLRVDGVIGGAYPRVRRSGRGWPGDAATLIGHPERLSAKVDLAGVTGTLDPSYAAEWPRFANLHSLAGSSGGPIYNRSQRVLEAVLAFGGGVDFVVDPQTLPLCLQFAHVNGFENTNASLRYFAEHIPAYELAVENLDPVVLVAAAGVPISSVTTRTVTAPATASSPLDYQIVAPPLGPGAPSLSISTSVPDQGTLDPGEFFDITQTASAPFGLPCNIYERTYEVRDLTNGFTDIARHVFEIGAREFSVDEPEGSRTLDDLAAPFEETLTYTITNPRPTAVTVRVSRDEGDDWVTLNGTTDTKWVDVLVPAGGTATVAVGIGEEMLAMPYATHFGNLTFAVAPGSSCPILTPPVQRVFNFAWGTEAFTAAGGAIPNGPTTGAEFELDVPEDFCIASVIVDVVTTGVPASQLRLKLLSPQVSRRLIWDHGVTPGDIPLVAAFSDAAPPHPVQPLSVLNGENGGGDWLLTAVDDVAGSPNGALTSWTLTFTACPLQP